jgi:acetyl/propionyl-CoA carboxylase alpha subunit
MDLVREQVLIASGHNLSYGASDLKQLGHSIECRIYAEVPEENFRPSTGTIEIFEPPVGPGIRLDSGVGKGSTVSYHFDPMLAKLIVCAPSREAAIDRMKRALGDFVLLGVRNNIEFLQRVISSDDFAAGKLDTGFLDRHRELFEISHDVPPEAILAASLPLPLGDGSRAAAGEGLGTYADVWTSGSWRNS